MLRHDDEKDGVVDGGPRAKALTYEVERLTSELGDIDSHVVETLGANTALNAVCAGAALEANNNLDIVVHYFERKLEELSEQRKGVVTAVSKAQAELECFGKKTDRLLPYLMTPFDESGTTESLLQADLFSRSYAVDEEAYAKLRSASRHAKPDVALRNMLAKAYGCEADQVLIFHKTKTGYRFWFEYNPEFTTIIKSVEGGYFFDTKYKCWYVRASAGDEMFYILFDDLKLFFTVIFDAYNGVVLKKMSLNNIC